MRPPKMSDEEVKQVALKLKEETGTVTIDALRRAVGGGTQRISRLIREVNGGMPASGPAREESSGDGGPTTELPAGLGAAVDQFVTTIQEHLQKTAAESEARARASERALIDRYDAMLAAAEARCGTLEEYLDQMDVALTETTEERDAAQNAVDDLQRRLTDTEAQLAAERAERATERLQTEGEIRAARDAAQGHVKGRHAAELERTRLDAELRALTAARDEERETFRERFSALEASRDRLLRESEAARTELEAVRRELASERATARRLDELLTGRLGEPPTASKPRGYAKRTAKSGEAPNIGT